MLNADRTGLYTLRKGASVVRNDLVGRVVKVSRGSVLVQWPGVRYVTPHACTELALLRPGAFTRSTCGLVQLRLF